MTRHVRGWWVTFLFLSLPLTAWGQTPADAKYKEDVLALAKRIDALIETRCKEAKIELAPPAPEWIFYRRLNLDLVGRIPALVDAREPENPDPDRHWQWTSRMLSSNAYASHFANVWRAHILSNTDNQLLQGLQPSFELWLRERLKSNAGYDTMVQEILLGAGNQNFNGMNASPQAFFVAAENKPENLAGSVSRVFLGVKLECAQCHAHPFAKWTREQFWEFAAFFSGNQGGNPRNAFQQVQPVDPNRREIMIPGTNKTVKARFLNGQEPNWKEGGQPRAVLANWVTSPENPFFAKATADHLWTYFFGTSLLEPILEPSDDSITHPQILDEMAKELIAHKFDLKFLAQAIVHTRAYQRSSSSPSKASREEYQLFARMPVRGMTPEMLYDSVAEATYLSEPNRDQPFMNQNAFNQMQTPRGAFLNKFITQDKRSETQTSILQALFMMNGKFLTERLDPEKNPSLDTLVRQRTSTESKLDTLYLMVLSRLPSDAERSRLVRYIDGGDARRTIPDVFWALLNSAEFMLNH